MQERLQKILARAGIASRRAAEEFIKQGRVTVDGEKITEMGCKVDPRRQRIELDGKPITSPEEKIYLLLNKPKGYLTTLNDPQGRPIVTSLLAGIEARVFPVGRLDLDTEGALILTNDGELAQQIQHPSHEVNKTYEALVAGQPTEKDLGRLQKGIMLEGRRTYPARLTVIRSGSRDTLIRITIHEGRKRQVRKMFKALGHPVISLKRTAYGRLDLGGLAPGKFRFLSRTDLALLFENKNPLYKTLKT